MSDEFGQAVSRGEDLDIHPLALMAAGGVFLVLFIVSAVAITVLTGGFRVWSIPNFIAMSISGYICRRIVLRLTDSINQDGGTADAA